MKHFLITHLKVLWLHLVYTFKPSRITCEWIIKDKHTMYQAHFCHVASLSACRRWSGMLFPPDTAICAAHAPASATRRWTLYPADQRRHQVWTLRTPSTRAVISSVRGSLITKWPQLVAAVTSAAYRSRLGPRAKSENPSPFSPVTRVSNRFRNSDRSPSSSSTVCWPSGVSPLGEGCLLNSWRLVFSHPFCSWPSAPSLCWRQSSFSPR